MTQQTLTPKQKRMQKAARLRYMEDMDNQSIADQLGLKEKTIRNYFASDEMSQFERFFSDQEIFQLQQSIERDLADAEREAKSMLSQAQSLADSSRAYKQTAKARMDVIEKKIKLLQELGVLEKPKERKQVEQSMDTSDVRDELSEIYKQKQQEGQEEEEEEQEVEAQ